MVMCRHLLVGLHIEKLAIVWAQEFLSLLRRYCRVAQESEKSDDVMMTMTYLGAFHIKGTFYSSSV